MRPEQQPVPVDASPDHRIAAAIGRYGEKEVAERAAALLMGESAGEEFLLYVGGRHAQGILDGAPALYWPEVWGARTLTHVWDDSAASAVESGLSNRAWRVREMCARVAATRQLPIAGQLEPLLTDEVARVRGAAVRALGEVGDSGQAGAMKALLKDPEVEVRRRAGEALARLKERTGS